MTIEASCFDVSFIEQNARPINFIIEQPFCTRMKIENIDNFILNIFGGKYYEW